MKKRRQNGNMAHNIKGGGIKRVVYRRLDARTLVVGLALLHFVAEMVSVIRFERESAFIPDHWNPVTIMPSPFLLLLGSVFLLLDRSWSYVLAILLAGNIVYSNIYRGLVGISYAHGVPVFSLRAARIWF